MSWPSRVFEPPSWEKRAGFFADLKRPAGEVEAFRFARKGGLPLVVALEKVAAIHNCSPEQAMDAIVLTSLYVAREAEGGKLSEGQDLLKTAVLSGPSIQALNPETVHKVLGLLGTAVGGTYGLRKHVKRNRLEDGGGGKTKWEREAEENLAAYLKKNPLEQQGYLKRMGTALKELSLTAAQVSKKHPIATATAATLFGASTGQAIGKQLLGPAITYGLRIPRVG